MEKEYWQDKWKHGNTRWDQTSPNPLLQGYFKQLHLMPEAKIFVPLCGKSIDMVWLIEQGYRIIGVELNLQACELFFNTYNFPYRYRQTEELHFWENEKITLITGDYFKLNQDILGNIDAVYDRGALVALPESLRPLYAQQMTNLINIKTQMFLITSSYDQSTMQGPPFSVDSKEVFSLYENYFEIRCLHKENIYDIPSHLKARGLQAATMFLFLLEKQK